MSGEEKVIEHLKIIQGVVERMARNSFQLKGWSVVLTAGWLVFLARVGEEEVINPEYLLVLFPFFLLLWLDAYYLWQERLFRRLYNDVRARDDTDFSMDTRPWQQEIKHRDTLLSRTVLVFYLAVGTLIVAAEVLYALGIL